MSQVVTINNPVDGGLTAADKDQTAPDIRTLICVNHLKETLGVSAAVMTLLCLW